MDNPGPSIYLALILLLAFSAFFSASETAVSSVNKIRLKKRAEDGDKTADIALHNADDYDKTLSAILIGNNVVNLSSASLATIIATSLLGESGAAVATVIITILVLIFGEILPKSYAKENAEKVTLFVARPLNILKTLLTPLVWIFVQIKRAFTGRRTQELNIQPSVTEDELKTIIDTVEEEGVLNRQETGIIQSAIDFNNTTVQEILVPRVDMRALESYADKDDIVRACVDEGFSRVPVYEGSVDNIIGILYAKDVLGRLARGGDIVPKELMRPVLFVYRTRRISGLLAEFRRKKQHMAIVTDDYGGTLGVVTLEDILEELVGEIWDETDTRESPITKLTDTRWQVLGEMNIEDVFDEIDFTDKSFSCDSTSVAGWALDTFEHIPNEGESFVYKTLTVTVAKTDEQRIEMLYIDVAKSE
ncbi:MAG: hemolysin family protein [Oscillospiraceae bacterium]